MDIQASPSTRSYAGAKGTTVEKVAETLGRSVIGPEDVDAAISGGGNPSAAAPPSAPPASRYWEVDHAAFGPVEAQPFSGIAKLAADNLSAANAAIPQVTHHDRAETSALDALRKRLRPEAEAAGVKLTALAFHVAALTRCLIEFARFNASLTAGGDQLILKRFVHVGIAVDTPNGLVVPVLRDTDRKGLFQIASEIADLAARAQSRKLRPEEMGGASMSISNLGGIGGIGFTPIVNPPEVAILGLTRTQVGPVWRDGAWQPVPQVPLDLSYDHRVVNGADAARFLVRYAALIEDPRRLVLPA